MLIRPLPRWTLTPGLATLALLGGWAMQSSGAPAAATTVKGVLMDKDCSARAAARTVAGDSPHVEGGMLWAYTHDRQCLLMPSCQRSGYGVFTYDDRFLVFDAVGNQKALALLQASKKQDDMRVEVAGEIDSGKIKVASLKLLP
jgi:hypothetical protein